MKRLLSNLALFSVFSEAKEEKLKLVIEVCRHGARAPQGDSNNLGIEWKEGFGNLTPIGKRQHYLIGQELRERYINKEKLLSEHFNPEEIYVTSSKYNRTIASAYS